MAVNPEIESLIATFAEIVRRYCSWAESCFGDSRQEMLTARKLLAELHLAIVDLPDLGCGENLKDVPESKESNGVYRRFKNMPIDGYWDVFDPLNELDTESVFNSLADDFTDIYLELKRGLLYYDRGHIIQALWEWRFSFYIHWGTHLVGAQRAIHSYFCSDEKPLH